MKFFECLNTILAYFLNTAYFLPYQDHAITQSPVLGDQQPLIAASNDDLVFYPPGRKLDGPGSRFQCNYTAMPGWRECSTELDRGCWLTHENGTRLDIRTDYEHIAPLGIKREYTLHVYENKSMNIDGLSFTQGKLFDNKFPGPWIQGCWGDTVEVTVHNHLKHNGTSVHWHGIRQLSTAHMDGVNGITQCPIAPGKSFTYRWKALQYGSAWYHSHYSLQYADGLLGPLTIHGPSSYPYDEAAETPLLISDWGHNSAFQAIYSELMFPSILLNGVGNVTRANGTTKGVDPESVPKPYTIHFENVPGSRPKRYLLRLINTSFGTTFVFSIDHHKLTVASADFVPIHKYTTTSVLVGIGQRYNIIVEADPIAHGVNTLANTNGNFWIRTHVANCGLIAYAKGHEKIGILRYNKSSTDLPTTTQWPDISLKCSDEPYDKLVPILPWKVEDPANRHFAEEFDVTKDFGKFTPGKPNKPFPVATFALDVSSDTEKTRFTPLRINFDNPTFLHLNDSDPNWKWPKPWVIVPENYTENDWVYLAIAGDRLNTANNRSTIGAHPIHLHGHDFALLQQAEDTALRLGNIKLKLNNPPRRDVVLLPRDGFVIIAFKADNPGPWLLHCHIAKHASEGLGIQILERQSDAFKIWPDNDTDIKIAQQVCKDWKEWQSNCTNWWSPDENPRAACECKDQKEKKPWCFQDDSGV